MYGMLHTTFTTHLADGNEHSIHGAYDRFESKHDVLYQSPFYGTISTLAMGAGGLDDGNGDCNWVLIHHTPRPSGTTWFLQVLWLLHSRRYVFRTFWLEEP